MALYWRESGSKFVSNFQFLGFLVAIKHIFNDVINVDSNVLSSPTSSSDSFSRSGGSNEALFDDNNLQRSSIRNSKHSSTLSSSVQVTTQIHPPPSLSMSLSYGSGAGIQVSISYRIYTGCSMRI